ncbi:MAG: 16S rRNA (guanine(966)-N(2))-methyltransferase RsmD [Microbacteriaceae bacterium]
MLDMTRIIGGIAGSLKLVPPAKSTRPTADRIRESIFNRLDARGLIDGAKVLDLYAGTGALGLEAISRGAARLVMVEKDVKAAKVCQSNAALLAKNDVGEMLVVNQPVQSFLASGSSRGVFDLVFIDPPYEISNEEISKNLEGVLAIITDDSVIMVERSSRTGVPDWPNELALDDHKTFGDTSVFWLSRS